VFPTQGGTVDDRILIGLAERSMKKLKREKNSLGFQRSN